LLIQKKVSNFGQNLKEMNTKRNNSQEIRDRIIKGGPNKMYSASDFSDMNNSQLVAKVLSRLEKETFLVRLTQGLYLYPQRTRFGIVKPTMFEIATAVMERDHSKVLPSGMTALNQLGLSTQVPMKAVFITNGTPRTIKVGNQEIVLKRATPKIFSYKSKLFPMVELAMKEIGKENIDDSTISLIKEALSKDEDQVAVRSDYTMAPQWIKSKLSLV